MSRRMSCSAATAVRSRYATVLDWLAATHPAVAQHRLDCSGRTPAETTSEVAGLMGH